MPKLFHAYKAFIAFTNLISGDKTTEDTILDFLKTLISLDSEKDHLKPLIKALKQVSIDCNKQKEFAAALEKFDKYYQDYEDELLLYTNMHVLHNVNERLKIYSEIFNQ